MAITREVIGTDIWGENVKGDPAQLLKPSSGTIVDGWTLGNKPPRQTFNWLDYVQHNNIAFLEQAGMFVWDATITYEQYAIVRASDGLLYYSLQNSNLNQNPTTATTYWATLSGMVGGDPQPAGQIGGLLVTKSDADTLAISAGWCHLKSAGGTEYLVEYAGGTLDVAGLSGNGIIYVYVSSAGTVASSDTPPTYDASKVGYYNGSGDQRFIGSWPYLSGQFRGGWREDNDRVLFTSETSLSAAARNGFTVEDISAYCPSIEGGRAFGFILKNAANSMTFILRPTGTAGSGLTFISSFSGWETNIWEIKLSSSGTYELDTNNVATGTHTLHGYSEPR